VPEQRAGAFARLFEAVHEGVYIGTIGPDSSSTIAANPHLKLIFGYSSEAPDHDVRPFDRECFVDPQARVALLERLTIDGSVNDYLLRLRRADGNPVWVELTGRAETAPKDGPLGVVDAGGPVGPVPPVKPVRNVKPVKPVENVQIVRIEALMRDVSERKKLDDQTRDLYHQLLQAEKMATLGQTVSGVAHELNNPLATILTWAERLSQRAALDEPVRRGLETILSESERAARIVRNLLTFARKRQTTRAMVDINQVARETLALRAYEQRVSNITVIDALAAGLPHVFADGHQIQQVLLNLVINGEQAMLAANGRGTLVVRTWHDPDQESVILEINDDGPGIPDEVQPKIFDPFFTTKEVGKGTGLGLTVAYAIVQEHGGRIRLETHPDAGASFYVELPVSGGKLAPAPVTRGPHSRGGGRDSAGRRGRRCAAGRRVPRQPRGGRRGSARENPGTGVRSRHLRPENAAAGRQGVLPQAVGRLAGPGQARHFCHGRRRGHRCGGIPQGERVQVARETIQARRLAASRAGGNLIVGSP
jgi:signal transduction histidine kinase